MDAETTTKFKGDIVFNDGEKDILVSDLATVEEVNEALNDCVTNDKVDTYAKMWMSTEPTQPFYLNPDFDYKDDHVMSSKAVKELIPDVSQCIKHDDITFKRYKYWNISTNDTDTIVFGEEYLYNNFNKPYLNIKSNEDLVFKGYFIDTDDVKRPFNISIKDFTQDKNNPSYLYIYQYDPNITIEITAEDQFFEVYKHNGTFAAHLDYARIEYPDELVLKTQYDELLAKITLIENQLKRQEIINEGYEYLTSGKVVINYDEKYIILHDINMDKEQLSSNIDLITIEDDNGTQHRITYLGNKYGSSYEGEHNVAFDGEDQGGYIEDECAAYLIYNSDKISLFAHGNEKDYLVDIYRKRTN